MVPPNFVELMDVADHAVHAHSDKNAAEVTVPVPPIALVANVEMTVAVETLVEAVLTANHAKTESVLVLVSEPVELEFVDTTELVVHVDHAHQDKDAVEESVNVIMTVTRETVVQQLLMPDLSAPPKLVDHVLLVSLAVPADNALPLLPVTSI